MDQPRPDSSRVTTEHYDQEQLRNTSPQLHLQHFHIRVGDKVLLSQDKPNGAEWSSAKARMIDLLCNQDKRCSSLSAKFAFMQYKNGTVVIPAAYALV
ncbi:hypothetical protein llap_18517 [Limosa lapponica baueri]|uniref:Uncharacterized protein n=1 Tax=Limosa lapponica baueri TaxID=1758121 RepID=A0A2I0TBL2_LIMLA|nr:hypothetical protein llap_18517 [Limosa lapponica baueri]